MRFRLLPRLNVQEKMRPVFLQESNDMPGLNRLEMRNISIAFGGFAALSSVDFRSDGHS
ncbi:MAG TPA: ABC transporter, partial [Pantoea sp.]|nr:ABC transporter [Pantoea sp.]